MSIEIEINDLIISAVNFNQELLVKDGEERKKLSIDFKVSSEQYHDVTTQLYKNNFTVKVPEKGLVFPAEIHNYSTSITNLYTKDAVGDFHIELIERVV